MLRGNFVPTCVNSSQNSSLLIVETAHIVYSKQISKKNPFCMSDPAGSECREDETCDVRFCCMVPSTSSFLCRVGVSSRNLERVPHRIAFYLHTSNNGLKWLRSSP